MPDTEAVRERGCWSRLGSVKASSTSHHLISPQSLEVGLSIGSENRRGRLDARSSSAVEEYHILVERVARDVQVVSREIRHRIANCHPGQYFVLIWDA
jgi:hypothetical protein